MGFCIENGVLKRYNEEPGVKEVIIPDGVKEISGEAFKWCSSLTSITIPKSVIRINKSYYGYGGLSSCASLTSLIVDSDNPVYASENNFLLDKSKTCVIDYSRGLPSVTIPDSVTKIDNDVFSYCNSLTSIMIPTSVTEISGDAFKGCTNLTSVTIPGSVTKIGESAFEGCTNLLSLTILDGVTAIGSDAFKYCYSLTTVNIPDSVKKIGRDAFFRTRWLTNYPDDFVIINGILIKYKGSDNTVIIPDRVTEISGEAFEKCTNLIYVKIPNSVELIGYKAFSDCKKLKAIKIPNSVKEIGYGVFMNCDNLNSITIPDSVKEIGNEAFSGCKKLKAIKIPNGVKKISTNAFCGCKNLKSVTLSNSLTIINWGAFRDCKKLKSITIPDTVEEIGNYAFKGCKSLTSVRMSNSVKKMGEEVFESCNDLTLMLILQFIVIGIPKIIICWLAHIFGYLIVVRSCKAYTNYIYRLEYRFRDWIIVRDCSDINYSIEEFNKDRDVIKSKSYSEDINAVILYPCAIMSYLYYRGKGVEEFIKENLSEMMQDSIHNGDICFISVLCESDKFFNQNNIDEFIELAQQEEQREVLIMLRNYKHKHFGSDEKIYALMEKQ